LQAKKQQRICEDSQGEQISILVKAVINPEESNETPSFDCQKLPSSHSSSPASHFQDELFKSCKEDTPPQHQKKSDLKMTLNVPLMQ
jgi:hypothetical protein